MEVLTKGFYKVDIIQNGNIGRKKITKVSNLVDIPILNDPKIHSKTKTPVT